MHNQPGSPDSGEPVFLAIGRLRRTNALHGDLIMDVLTDIPERLAPGKVVYLGDKHREYTIRGIRPHTNSMLISFEGLIRLKRQLFYATIRVCANQSIAGIAGREYIITNSSDDGQR
jgi:ribosomal 30S subunit maturation factor RimM